MVSHEAQAEQELRELSERAFDGAGVDLTQIDMMLAMTPRERLQALQGAPAVTFDLDILYSRTEDNVVRLLGALRELERCSEETRGVPGMLASGRDRTAPVRAR